MRKLIVLLIVLNSLFLGAQDYNFGKVSKEELSEKSNPMDSAVVATYLYKYRRTYFEYIQNSGFQLVTDVHERIKVYNKDGFDYATRKINLYKDGGTKEKISGLRANTYNLVNDRIEDSKLKSDGEFVIDLSKFYDQKTFTLPNVREGSIIEYKFKLQSPFISVVDEFRFQHDIPVKKLVASFEVPEYFSYNVNTKGFLPIVPKIESGNDEITFNDRTRTGGAGFSTVKTSFNSSKIRFSKKISRYDLTDIPALKNEPYVNNIDNYRSAVKYELAFTKFPNSPIENYSTNWEAVVKKIYESPDFGTELTKKGYYEKDLEPLLVNIDDPLKKVSIIFDYVKSKVKWNGYYGKYTDVGVRQAYKEQTGNVAEINLMLTSMLRSAGLNADPVLISTRDNGIPIFPTREGYNYVISGVVISDDIVLLDASSSYSTPNVLPLRALNWEGRMIKKDGSSTLVNLYPTDTSIESIALNIDVRDNGDLEGKIRRSKMGHDAMHYRGEYNYGNEDEYIEKLENKYGGLEITDFEVVNKDNLSESISESYGFIQENGAEIIGNRLYFSPLFFLGIKENPFKLEKREFPVDFAYPSETKYRIGVSLPEGYIVETLPEPSRIKLPDDLGDFTFNVVATSGRIQILVNTKIDQSIISPVYYESLKDYFKLIIGKMNEKIVLSKI